MHRLWHKQKINNGIYDDYYAIGQCLLYFVAIGQCLLYFVAIG